MSSLPGIPPKSVNKNDLLDRISNTKQKLQNKLNEINDITTNVYYDILYYIIIVSIMFFFLYVILSDLYKTLKIYESQNEDTKRMSFRKSKNVNDDDNEYPDNNINTKNTNAFVRDGIDKRNSIIFDEMEKLIKFKAENNLDKDFKADIDISTLQSEKDDYLYPNKKKDSSFWNMLFEKPKHYSMVNDSQGGYFNF